MFDFPKVIQLIDVIAKLAATTLWPIVVLVLVMLFKGEISSVIKRIKRGKVLGNEFELSEKLDELAKTTEKAQREIYVPPSPSEPPAEPLQIESSERDIEKIIDIASDKSEFGLILLAQTIEKEMKRLLAMTGHLGGRRSVSYRDMAEYLGRNSTVSGNLRKSLDLFWDVRNKIVHGHGSVDKENLIRAIDIGLTILSAIKAIPHEKNIVAHPGADMFADQEGRQPIEGVKALILETTAPEGSKKLTRVFPTTKTHYRQGMTVSWEWNMDKTWAKCYYRDPWTSEIKNGWNSAAEFVGRDIEAI